MPELSEVLKDGVLYTIKDDAARESLDKKIPKPEGGAEVGQYLRVAAVDARGNITAVESAEVAGGGGGGSGYGSTMKLTSSLDSRIFSIMASEESCVIPYNWSSTDTEDGSVTGNGSAAWTVNGSRVAVQRVPQGDNSFDVRKYLTDGEENEILLTVSDAYGNSKNMGFSISVTSFGLSWNLAEMAYHKDNILTIRLVPTGGGTKTVKVTVDGKEVYSTEVTTSGRTVSTSIGPLTHGAHTILAWLETVVEGQQLETEPLRHVGIWTEVGMMIPVVGVLYPKMTVQQYSTAAVKYMAIDPAKETAQVEQQAGGTSTVVTADRTMQTWPYKPSTVGTETLKLVCGTAFADVELEVTGLGYEISPITAGLVLDIDPSGHTNTEDGRESFGYKDAAGVNHPFTFSQGFDWTRGGFQLDDEGVTAFVIPRGCYVTADCSLFADNAKTNGKELKLIFKSMNVRNYDAELLNCMSGNVGIKLQAQQATIGSEAESTTVPYCEGRKIEMDVNIEAESENRLAYVCMDAIPSAKPIQYGTTDSWTQATPKLLTIGSEDADVWIYRIKAYSSSLSRFEILDNFIADCASPEEMADRYNRNAIFNEDGTISISKLTARNAKLRAIHIRAKRMTTGKDDEVTADVEIIYEAGGAKHHLIAQNVVFKAQGTSSLEYILAALNLDVDFSKATSWVDGTGAEIRSYAFTENSIPVNYFNLKADVASSESANNVVLCDEFNSYNPAPFDGKTGKVRDTIEGHPCAVFFTNTSDATVSIGARSVDAGETVLYFAGNMNNSKKNFEVFGWDSAKWPEQCCVEVLNNISLQCRFRSADLSTETWDGAEGTSNFEFSFPKKPTDAMKAKFMEMQAWVVSTASDLATGDALSAPVTYGAKEYTTDTEEYRKAKFLAEFDNYFVRDQMLFHFLKTERHCMTDNRSKNLFLCYDYYADLGGYRWSVRRQYDGDTGEGCDNSGGATFTYGLELDDKVGDSYVFNANDNTIWQNISNLMYDELLRVYKSNKDAWDATRIKKKFNDYQAITPEAIRMEDMWNKYFQPLLLAGEAAFLKRCHGKKEAWRDQFETYQDVYMNSKYADTSDRSNCISLRATVESADAGNIDITPYSDLYVTVMYGTNGTVRIRAKRNQLYTVECPVDSLTDTETYIFSASHLKELGSLAELKTKFVTLTKAEKLQVLPIGSGDVGYQNLNMTELGLGNSTMMEYLDVRGLPNLKGAMDLSALTSLEEFYGNGSGITSLTFAKGAPLRIARVPAVNSLTARDLNELETFIMDGSKLQSIWVEDCPAIDTLALCKAATGLIRGRLTNVVWEDYNADVLVKLANLQSSGGLDAFGNTIDGFVLTGKAFCASISASELALVKAAFPDLDLSYGSLVPTFAVAFKNWDGTVLSVQHIKQGGSARDPVAAGLIATPTKESTVEAHYSFIGWDTPYNGIVADTVVTAVYAETMRTYTVRYWQDSFETTLVYSTIVDVHGNAPYTGEDLVGGNAELWTGWDAEAVDVTSDMDIHAVWVTPVIPSVVPTDYDYLYSDDPDDNSGYSLAEFYGIIYSGRAKDYFTIGDKIKMVCSTDVFTDTEIVLRLIGYNHFKLADGSGEFAHTVFDMVGVMDSAQEMSLWASGAQNGWGNTDLRDYLNEDVFPALPVLWRNLIKTVEVLGCSDPEVFTTTITSNDRLFLLSVVEVWSGSHVGGNTYNLGIEIDPGAEETTFSVFTDAASTVKRSANGTGEARRWWTRSNYANVRTGYLTVAEGGYSEWSSGGSSGGYPSFAFCI